SARLDEVIDAINQSSEHLPPEVRLVAVRADRNSASKSSGNAGGGLSASDIVGAYARAGDRGTPRRGGGRAAIATTSGGPVLRPLLCLRGKHLGRDVDFPALRGSRDGPSRDAGAGRTLSYRRRGSGPLVVCLPGCSGSCDARLVVR